MTIGQIFSSFRKLKVNMFIIKFPWQLALSYRPVILIFIDGYSRTTKLPIEIRNERSLKKIFVLLKVSTSAIGAKIFWKSLSREFCRRSDFKITFLHIALKLKFCWQQFYIFRLWVRLDCKTLLIKIYLLSCLVVTIPNTDVIVEARCFSITRII